GAAGGPRGGLDCGHLPGRGVVGAGDARDVRGGLHPPPDPPSAFAAARVRGTSAAQGLRARLARGQALARREGAGRVARRGCGQTPADPAAGRARPRRVGSHFRLAPPYAPVMPVWLELTIRVGAVVVA